MRLSKREGVFERFLNWIGLLAPILATIAALLAGTIMLLALDADPLRAYASMVQGAFGGINAISDTIVRATPLLFVGTGICLAFRGSMINIGAEGQMIVGGLAVSIAALSFQSWPSWAIIPLCLLLGFSAGAIWGAIPGALKAYLKVNEILVTVMMNQIAIQMMNYLLRGPLMDPEQIKRGGFIPQTARLPFATDLPRLAPTRLHIGAFLAILVAILAWILLWRTTIGMRIRAVGFNPSAARRAGIKVEFYALLAMLLSGALAGLGGAIQLLGVYHSMITDGSSLAFTGNAGFNGIIVALFGQLHPLITIPSAVLFGGMIVGANNMQREMQVPSSMITALNGLLVLFVVGIEILRQYSAERREIGGPQSKSKPIKLSSNG
jgi:ABC-type uncharacterized transport system permease subunit